MHALGPTIRELTHFMQLDTTGSQEQKSDRAGIRLGNGEDGSQGWAAAKSKGKIRIGCYVLQLLHKCTKLWGKKRNSAASTLAFFGKNMILLAVKVSVHL